MKVKFNMTETMPKGVFYPYGYPKIDIKHDEVIDLPETIAKKLLMEYPKNLLELGLILPITNYDKKKVALELGYKQAFGFKNVALDAFLISKGYKAE